MRSPTSSLRTSASIIDCFSILTHAARTRQDSTQNHIASLLYEYKLLQNYGAANATIWPTHMPRINRKSHKITTKTPITNLPCCLPHFFFLSFHLLSYPSLFAVFLLGLIVRVFDVGWSLVNLSLFHPSDIVGHRINTLGTLLDTMLTYNHTNSIVSCFWFCWSMSVCLHDRSKIFHTLYWIIFYIAMS